MVREHWRLTPAKHMKHSLHIEADKCGSRIDKRKISVKIIDNRHNLPRGMKGKTVKSAVSNTLHLANIAFSKLGAPGREKLFKNF